LEYVTFETISGWVGILSSRTGLLATTLPQHSKEKARRQLGDQAEEAEWSPKSLADIAERLKAYFTGKKVAFPDKLDLSKGTSFQGAVWKQTSLIPYGETQSYQWVAEKIGKPRAARAVGQALGANPFLIVVPCHRVVASNGGLGGFGGGLDVKKRLLEMENRNRLSG
jgi:methylated-DNA-[protein]-cysteine S-methyltransferase